MVVEDTLIKDENNIIQKFKTIFIFPLLEDRFTEQKSIWWFKIPCIIKYYEK